MFLRIKNAIVYGINTLKLRVQYGKKIQLCGIGRISNRTKITIKNGGVISFGKGSRLCEYSSISVDGGSVIIGEYVGINKNMIMSSHGRIEIGRGTLFAPNVCIYDHNHRFNENGLTKGYSVGKITIGKNCWIGVNTTILKDTIIGDGCIIGAGCVISGEIPPYSIVKSNRDLSVTKIEQRLRVSGEIDKEK